MSRATRPWEINSRPAGPGTEVQPVAIMSRCQSTTIDKDLTVSLSPSSSFGHTLPSASSILPHATPNASIAFTDAPLGSGVAPLYPAKRPRGGYEQHENHWRTAVYPGDDGSKQYTLLRELIVQIEEEVAEHEVLVHGRRSSTNSLVSASNPNLPLDLLMTTLRLRLKESNLALQSLLNTGLPKLTKPPRHGSIRQESSSASSDTIQSCKNGHCTSSIGPGEMRSSMNYPNSPPSSIASLEATKSEPLPEIYQQLSEKSQAHASLTREHNLQLDKFAKLQVKLTALERKFEANCAENIALSTDKERLQDRIECLEAREHDLQQQCEEARKSGEDSKAQWLRIVSMAGKLQTPTKPVTSANMARATEGNERSWDEERLTLLARIEDLQRLASNSDSDGALKSQMTDLDGQLDKLHARNQKLEAALEAAKAAALTLAVQGQNVGITLKKALTGE